MQDVRDFVAERTVAVVGVSRGGKKFANGVYRTLRQEGYTVYPVHPEATEIEGDPCYPSLAELPGPVRALFICVPPPETERVVAAAASAGIERVWMQQGSASQAAIRACEEAGITVVHGECLLMFTAQAGFLHRAHRWVAKISGKLPS